MGQCSCLNWCKQGNEDGDNQDEAAENRAGPLGPAGNQAGPAGGTQRRPWLFGFDELQRSTDNFSLERCIREVAFANVYIGTSDSGEIVMVKRLNPPMDDRMKKEFAVEIRTLSPLRHPNIIRLLGSCDDPDQRILICEHMPWGSLSDHLHARKPEMEPMDWNARMKIAAAVARGLNHLHNEATPRVILGELRSSDILLGEGFETKLAEFGMAKPGPFVNGPRATTEVKGTPPYWAPECSVSEEVTFNSDVYSFGVVLLEIITGKIPSDEGEPSLEDWLRTLLTTDESLAELADPNLQGQFPEDMLRKALIVASICISVNPDLQPNMIDVVHAMNYLTSDPNAGDWPMEFEV